MTAEILLNLSEVSVLLVIFLLVVRLIIRGSRSISLVFFGFALACTLLSDFYWLTYDLLRPEVRMPVAANEIGESAMFLLLGAALTARHPIRFQRDKWALLSAGVFTVANAALWIAWSGEWGQDILGGLAYGYFLCALASRIRQESIYAAWKKYIFGALCLVVIAIQTSTFFFPDPVRRILDISGYVLLFAFVGMLLVRAVLSLRQETPAWAVCRSFLCLAWTLTAMYMSAGAFYAAALILCSLCYLLMYLAIRKEVAAE